MPRRRNQTSREAQGFAGRFYRTSHMTRARSDERWGKPVVPIIEFSDPDEFRARHKEATEVEYEIQKELVDHFNKENPILDAWVILAPPPQKPWVGYIVRVGLNRLPEGLEPPGIGQSCQLRIVKSDGTFSAWFSCRSGAEILSLNRSWDRIPEFVVYPPEHDAKQLEDYLVPLLETVGSEVKGSAVRNLRSRHSASISVQLQLQASKATMLAELGALNRLTKGNAGEAGKSAFLYLLDFKEPKIIANLTTTFPQLADLEEVKDAKLRKLLREAIDGFDEDQKTALEGINHMPEHICFVPGGPGAGKTRWALTMAVLAQSGEERCQTLYLVDVNKPVDDAANRMYAMYGEDFEIDRSVIRVRSWPLADSTARSKDGEEEEEEDEDDEDDLPRALKDADFTEGFFRAMDERLPRDKTKAPTLDERAWECYKKQPGKYGDVDAALSKVLAADYDSQDSHADMRALRKSLVFLYLEVLIQADFIATTPVAAPRLRDVFKPQIVIFDECAHARELSTMISLAYFNPKAWFFVGDHRQTDPFVQSVPFRYSRQLKMSTMERAHKNEVISHQLLVNHRAYGGLERLASDLFYDSAMRSDKDGDELLPPSVQHLRQWLSTLAKGHTIQGDLRIPRLIISDLNADHVKPSRSFWNPKHHDFVMAQVETLLHDRSFVQVNSTELGTIMILSPYRAAVHNYQGAVNKFPTTDMKRRVQVRTVDTAQGQEADVVFLDMVLTYPNPHTDNAKRLCVALTRARQAEVIMMRESMACGHASVNLRAVWEKCWSGEQGAVVTIAEKRSSESESSGGWGAEGGW